LGEIGKIENMKSKIIIAMVGGLLACSLAVTAQENSPAVQDTEAASTNAQVQPDPGATPPAAAGESVAANQSAAQPEASGEASATNSAAMAEAAPENQAAAVTNEDNAVAAAAPAESDQTNAAIIPLIVMDDVPLTDAVKNLARQANLNYMLDPKISYGQPGPDGKVQAQPTVSIRWENVTAEQALNALLNNYGLQMVQDTKTKIARVTIKDPAAPEPLITKIIRLNFANPSNILTAVKTTLTDKRSRVIDDIRTSQLVVVATEKEMDGVNQMIARLDTPTKQVLIEARLVETTINPTTMKGLDWTGTLQSQNLSFGNNLQTKPVTSGDSVNPPLATLWPKMMVDTAKGFNPATAFLNADGVNAVLSFLNTDSEAKVISEPRAVTLDNETAHLEVTTATPIINVTAGTANTTGGSQITYTNLGIILDVTPRISANDFINLKVIPEVSRFNKTDTKIIQGQTFQADEYDVRRVETRVMIPSGNTLVLGGLVQDDNRMQDSKVPILGDVPGLGLLFRHDYKSRQKSNLLVFITPTIVQDTDFKVTKSSFLRTPIPDDKIADWSAWDSGKPYSWGKKAEDKATYSSVP
jgi:type II secretory pathway component GspD/PulD (secretin)